MAQVKVRVEGLKELQKRLRGNELYAEPLRQAFAAIGDLAVQVARGRAPVGKTGQLKAQIRAKVSPAPIPRYVVLKTTAVRRSRKFPRGYPYPAIVEFSPRSKHRGWMRGVIDQIGGQINALLNRAADAIERHWKD